MWIYKCQKLFSRRQNTKRARVVWNFECTAMQEYVSALWVCECVSVCVCVCVRVCVCVPVWGGNITKKHFYSVLCYCQFSFLSVCPNPSQSRLHKEKFETHFLSYYVQTSHRKNGEEVQKRFFTLYLPGTTVEFSDRLHIFLNKLRTIWIRKQKKNCIKSKIWDFTTKKLRSSPIVYGIVYYSIYLPKV
jgi:hypothetical protein